jgi:hypothetical protein
MHMNIAHFSGTNPWVIGNRPEDKKQEERGHAVVLLGQALVVVNDPVRTNQLLIPNLRRGGILEPAHGGQIAGAGGPGLAGVASRHGLRAPKVALRPTPL